MHVPSLGWYFREEDTQECCFLHLNFSGFQLSNDGVSLYHAVADCSPLNTSFVCISSA